MEFVETPSFWCPHVDRAACNNFRTRTVELQPSENRAIFPFPFLLPFLSLFFSPFLSTNSFPLVSFFPFLFAFLFFLYLSFHFLLTSFSHSFLLTFSSLLHFLSSLWSNIDRMGQRRKFPPHFLMPFNVVLNFLPFSFISYFLFLISPEESVSSSEI